MFATGLHDDQIEMLNVIFRYLFLFYNTFHSYALYN